MNIKFKNKLHRVLILYIPLTILLLATILPFYWILITSFKVESSIMKLPLLYLPSPFTFDNYLNVCNSMGFLGYFINGLIVSLTTTLAIMLISILGGYSLSRYKFKGKSFTMFFLLITQMLPGVIILIPLFTIFYKFHLINNLMSLIIVNTTVNLPFCMIMMSGFFSTIPHTLEEAAYIDGCSRLQAVFKIVVPAVIPGIVSSSAFAFVNSWNEFIYALNFINNSKLFTLPVGLSMMKGEFTVNYGSLAAGIIIALIPVLLVFRYIQKYMVEGATAGAIKG